MRSHSWSAVVGATGKTNARLASFFPPCLHLPTPSSALPIRETGIPLTPDTVRHLSLISGCAGSARGAGRRVLRCGLQSSFIPSAIYLPFSSTRMLIDRCSHVGRFFGTSSLFSPLSAAAAVLYAWSPTPKSRYRARWKFNCAHFPIRTASMVSCASCSAESPPRRPLRGRHPRWPKTLPTHARRIQPCRMCRSGQRCHHH